MKWLVLVVALSLACCAGKEDAAREEPAEGQRTNDEAHPEKYLEEANVVELSLDAQKRAGIEVAPVRMRTVQDEVRVTGTVQPIESRIVHLRPLARGRVEQVVAKVGDRVRKDQVLAHLDNIEAGELSSQIATAQAELQRLKIQHANARRQAGRSRSLVAIGAVPAKEAEAAETEARALEEAIRAQESAIAGIEMRLKRFGVPAGADPSSTTIRTPFAGVVINAEAAPGDVADTGSVLFAVADLSRVYVEAQVYEKDLGKIQIGQSASITVDAYPGQTIQGCIATIRDILNPQTRTAAVRFEVPNRDGRLRLEMFTNLAIPTTDTHTALALPVDAIQTINRRQIVFVRKAELHFEAREVQILGDGALTEITAGLKEGEPVVVKGAFQLKSAFLAKQLESEHGH
ncbi:MAG TPA: efflux RND transporter periplasmic adaptor subunit [Bryobacteraceae bacterium]|nr:efflux RND transporter periplasmic adaptor subunit [Bryobacteraceae bacterium]